MTLLIVAASLLALARASGPQASCAVGQRCAAGEQDDTGMLSMLQKSSQRMPVTRHEQSSVKTTPTAPSQPNIVIALIDDLGWDDVHQGDDGLIKTPHMDQLALKEGIYLKRQYSYNWCGPSRSSIMTGRLPTHVYFAHVDSLAINPANPGISAGAPTGMSMISDKMKGAGYSTVYHGKWGVGYATHEHMPLQRGYDEFYGYLDDANDYWTKDRSKDSATTPGLCEANSIILVDIWEGDKPAFKSNNTVWEDFMFEQKTLQTIRNHDTSKPLFLFHAFHSVHTPLNPPVEMQDAWYPEVKDPTRRGYATMVTYVDTAIGQFVNALKEKDMWNNTIMLVASDNGGPIYAGNLFSLFGGADNGELRGGKTSDWEGGIRVRSFVTGGYLPQDRRGIALDGYAHFADWLATFSTLAGYDAVDKKAIAVNAATDQGLPPIDSFDLLPYLMGDVDQSPRDSIFMSDKTAIQGQHKIIFGNGGCIMPEIDPNSLKGELLPDAELMKMDTVGLKGWALQAVMTTFHHGRNCTHGCVFNIFEDPSENTDLSASDPALHQEMTAVFNEMNKTLWTPDRGSPSVQTCRVLLEYGGYRAPFFPSINHPNYQNYTAVERSRAAAQQHNSVDRNAFWPGTQPPYLAEAKKEIDMVLKFARDSFRSEAAGSEVNVSPFHRK